MTTVIHHPIKFREVRPDHYLVMKDGKRVGTLVQNPKWTDSNPGRWRYWPEGQPPTPHFRDLEEAMQAVGDLY